MYTEGNSKINKLLVFLLNLISIKFKAISFINLKIKSLRKKRFQDVFIISVDNLSFGGTGKTSLVIEIGKCLEKRNIRFAIVTRGYKSKFEKTNTEVKLNHSFEQIGDEAKLLKEKFPAQDIFIGKNRIRSINRAISKKNKIIIIDDGFQSTNIQKDIKIMLINPNHPYYYLRNFKFLAKEEDLIIYYQKKGGLAETPEYMMYDFEIENFCDRYGSIFDLKGSSITGFSALGDNLRFENDLKKYNLIQFHEFKDHHVFTENEIRSLNNLRIKHKADYLVCTEKDFIKIKDFELDDVPLIFSKNSIKFNVDLMGHILNHAEKKGFIKT